MKHIIATCFVLTLFLSSNTHAQLSLSQLPSGEYDDSSIAVNPGNNTISGYVFDYRGDMNNPESSGFECEFYFSGKIQNNGNATIVANGMKGKTSTTGTVTLDPEKKAEMIININGLDGCEMMGDYFHLYNMSNKMNWLEIRLVSASRGYFYDSAESKHHRKAYVVCGDMVNVTAIDKASGRVKAEYGKTRGWLLEKDLLGIGGKQKCK